MVDTWKTTDSPENCPDDHFVAVPGARIPWLKDDYGVGREGLVGIFPVAEMPVGWLVFIEKGIIVHVMVFGDADVPEKGTYDGVMCHPDTGELIAPRSGGIPTH